MSSCLFTPQGQGPRPTVLLLHGYPGHENNYDLAHAFQRAGCTVVVFHYRGTWGSEGLFSLCHVLEDVSDAIDFIQEHSGEGKYRFDADRLILIGHSMGGFAALETACVDSRPLGAAALAAFDFSLAANHPRLREAVRQEFADCLPIKRIRLDRLMHEIEEHADAWSFPALTSKLARKPIYLIGGAADTISIPEEHFTPLAEELKKAGGPNFTAKLLDDTHSFSSTRLELAQMLSEWIRSLLA